MPLNVDLAWQRAVSFAARFHGGQFRKDGETPYVAHPFRVAMTLRHVFGIDDPVALCAALLHDVIEDTTADYDDIADGFGTEIAKTVAALTKDMRLPESQREPDYDARLREANWQARAVKLADVFDNLCDFHGAAMRGRAIEKARRAIDCAGNDERLKTAIARLQTLVEGLD
ncbi:MAG: HD domain-containing protein [Planctomycetes bacterium]|nr:HD domain-containing protein [Planctomycetota bacterium]